MHFIFVKKDGIFSMYLDNVFFFTDTTVYPGFENFANINIGACQIVDDSLNTYSPFYGCIDDVRIYNHALSSNEISQIYKTSAENHGACLHRWMRSFDLQLNKLKNVNASLTEFKTLEITA